MHFRAQRVKHTDVAVILLHFGKQPFQLFVVDLHPLALDKGQAFCLGEQIADLLFRQRNAADSQGWRHMQQSVQSEQRRFFVAHFHRHRERAVALLPPIRNTAQNAAVFQRGNVVQKLIRFLRRQTQGMKQLAALHESAYQCRNLRRLIQTRQQLQQLGTLVAVLGQRVLQRNMAHTAAVALCGVGRQKRKGKLSLVILHQMKKDALGNMKLLIFLREIQ